MQLQSATDGLTSQVTAARPPSLNTRSDHDARPAVCARPETAPIAGEEPRPTQDESLWSISLLVAPLDLATAPSGTVSPLHVINLEMLKLKQWLHLTGCRGCSTSRALGGTDKYVVPVWEER